MSAADVVAKLQRAYRSRAGDWSALRALYHPDARLAMVAGGPGPVSADDLITQLQQAAEDTWYSVTTTKTVVVDEHAVLFTGRMRRSVPGGGFEDASHVWLLTIRDGLIYRQGVYASADEAVAAYRELGVSLGMSGDSAPPAATDDRPQAEPARRWEPASGEA
jgi:ketosteroid isomerase-like protein